MPAREPLAPPLGGLVRVEASGVHTLRPEAYPLHALLKEVVHRGLRGAQVEVRPVVELSGPPSGRVIPEFQVVVASVGRHVGVIGGYQGYPEPTRVVDPARPEDKGVNRVDQVRTEASQGAPHAGVCEGELYPGIGREGHTGHTVDRGPRVGAGASVRVPWRYDEHLVTHAGQLLDGVSQPGHDAVGRRQKGLREERDAHRQAFLVYRFETMACVNSLVPAEPPRSLVRVSGLFSAASIPLCMRSASSL